MIKTEILPAIPPLRGHLAQSGGCRLQLFSGGWVDTEYRKTLELPILFIISPYLLTKIPKHQDKRRKAERSDA